MDTRLIALIVFACTFGSAMIGFLLGRLLPNHHLNGDAREIVKLATGLIATLSALVLGLMVSTAKGTFDQVGNELAQGAARAVLLDRVLAQYGPETNEIRARLKSGFATAVDDLASGDQSRQDRQEESFGKFERVQASIRALTPQNDTQRELQSRAIAAAAEMNNARWLLTVQRTGSISTPLLMMLVFWLALIFACWGMFSPRNLVVASALLACALSVSGAVFLIQELEQPLSGWIRVSPAPMQKALAHLGE